MSYRIRTIMPKPPEHQHASNKNRHPNTRVTNTYYYEDATNRLSKKNNYFRTCHQQHRGSSLAHRCETLSPPSCTFPRHSPVGPQSEAKKLLMALYRSAHRRPAGYCVGSYGARPTRSTTQLDGPYGTGLDNCGLSNPIIGWRGYSPPLNYSSCSIKTISPARNSHACDDPPKCTDPTCT